MELSFGPNMSRILDMDAKTIQIRATAGPGDTLIWEVRAADAPSGVSLELVGRGSDLEAAAAALMPLLTLHGSELQATPDAQQGSGQPQPRKVGSNGPATKPAAAFETSWVEDGVGIWHRSTHPVGYVESTSPWTFTTLCGRDLDTATPPALHAPKTGGLCAPCSESR
jgi:hypothetical protein